MTTSNLRPNQGKYSITSKGRQLTRLLSEEEGKIRKEIDKGESVYKSEHPLYDYWVHLGTVQRAFFVAYYGAAIGSEDVENILYELIEGGYVIEDSSGITSESEKADWEVKNFE